MKNKLLLALLCVSAARCALESGIPVQDFLGNYLPFKIIVKDHTTDSGRRDRLKEFVSSKEEEVTEERWLQFKEDFNIEDLGATPELLLQAILHLRFDVLDYWQSRGLDLAATYEKLVTEKPEPLFHYLMQEKLLTSADQEKFEYLATLFPKKINAIDQNGNSVLHIAVKDCDFLVQSKNGNNETFLAWLMQNGVMVDLKNTDDKTPWNLLNDRSQECDPQPNDDQQKKIVRHLKSREIHALMMVYNKLADSQQGKELKQDISQLMQEKKEELEEKQKEVEERKAKLENKLKTVEEQVQNDIYALQEQLKEFELNSNDFN